MFTGLVESVGRLERRDRRGPGFTLTIGCNLDSLVLGESISVNGVCLTVTRIGAGSFEADASAETVEVTTLGRIATGARVNLERALTLGTRLGGHLVSGHVDAVVRVRSFEPVGDARRLTVAAPQDVLSFVAPKGSVALDGVSLTVNERLEDGFNLMLVRFTQGATTLDALRPGTELNLEVDLLARYVVNYLLSRGKGAPTSAEPNNPAAPGGLAEALKRAGWM